MDFLLKDDEFSEENSQYKKLFDDIDDDVDKYSMKLLVIKLQDKKVIHVCYYVFLFFFHIISRMTGTRAPMIC